MLAARDPRGEVIPIYNNYYYRKEGEPSVEAEVADTCIASNYTRARRGRRTRVSGLKKEKRKKALSTVFYDIKTRLR